jgi:transposase
LADSLALRHFVGLALDEYTPDHSTISRTRRLIDLDTHREVFTWVLGVLADRGLLQGKRIAIDATTLEANAAMRSIVRRDTGESYEEFLRGLAKASGIETPSREELARLDRKRKKRTSNKEWKSPADEDARVAKMKDGRTHLAHKAEHAVDLDTGAVVAVTLQGADKGDTTTLDQTLCEAGIAVAEQIGREAELRPGDKPKVNVSGIEELVTDKGYHSGAVVERVKGYEVRSYIPQKQPKGKRNWAGKQREQQAVYANRRRVRGEYGKSLLRRRGELVERSFAHCYETGGLRRCHLRGRDNILKRQLVHVGAFNLSLVLRKLLGAGTPRELRNRFGRRILQVFLLLSRRNDHNRSCRSRIGAAETRHFVRSRTRQCRRCCRKSASSTTDC